MIDTIFNSSMNVEKYAIFQSQRKTVKVDDECNIQKGVLYNLTFFRTSEKISSSTLRLSIIFKCFYSVHPHKKCSHYTFQIVKL